MIPNNYKFTVQVIGDSVRGASHERRGLPNQDAILWVPASGKDLPLVLAVADGHGCSQCFRSESGAELAVTVATKAMQNFLEILPRTTNLSLIKQWIEEKLPREIVHSWRNAVADNLSANPFRILELEKLEEVKGSEARRQAVLNPPFAYGSTLLATLVTDSFIIYLQIGDGELLTVSETGEVCRPLPRDERNFAHETSSLCLKDAWQGFRVGLQLILDKPPALILLTTDGYPNSFVDDANFLKVGPDLLKIIRAEGIERVRKNLRIWLTEATEKGSGDDVTLGIICLMNGEEDASDFPPSPQGENTLEEERHERTTT